MQQEAGAVRIAGLEGDHLEVFLAGAAFGAGPVDWHVFPARAGSNAFVRQAGLFVVDPTTDQAHPGLKFCFAIAHG